MGDFLGRRVTRSFTAKVTVDECEMQEKQESEGIQFHIFHHFAYPLNIRRDRLQIIQIFDILN